MNFPSLLSYAFTDKTGNKSESWTYTPVRQFSPHLERIKTTQIAEIDAFIDVKKLPSSKGLSQLKIFLVQKKSQHCDIGPE